MEQSPFHSHASELIQFHLNTMSISDSDSEPLLPPLHQAVSDGDDTAVFALIGNPPPEGLQLEARKESDYFDCIIICTTLGTAVYFYSSVATINALLKAGANPLARISVDKKSKTLLQHVRATRKDALSQGSIEEFGEFWLEFCGRAPTASWFKQVEALLVAAEKEAKAKKEQATKEKVTKLVEK
jgi:hypothetical protein